VRTVVNINSSDITGRMNHPKIWRKANPTATLSPTNPRWTGLNWDRKFT